MREYLLALFVAGLLVGNAGSAAAESRPTPSFDYLYIEANEGGSSGGHAAVRFDSEVYHFQNRDRLLVLDRERSGEFLFDYALLNNRTIHVSQIAVEQDVATRLADRFRERYRAQAEQLAVQAALRQDLRLLESTEGARVSVGGYGYFARSDEPPNEPPEGGSGALSRLHQQVVARHGQDFWQRRRASLRRALLALRNEDPSAWPVELPDSAYDHPLFARPWSSRLVDLAAGFAALEALEDRRPLDPTAVNMPRDEVFLLEKEERLAVENLARRLESDLIGLVDSRREDWGQALLVGMARLIALEASLSSGRFVFLDSFPEEHGSIEIDTLQRRGEIVPLMLAETADQLAAARRYLVRTEDPGELAWERVEERLARHHELLRARNGKRALRLARGHLVPERGAPYPIPTFSPGASDEWDWNRSDLLSRVRARERDYARRLRKIHRYGLVSRNCVTELFDTLNAEFAESPEGSRIALGGIVPGPDVLDFVPFLSAHQVNARYRVLERYTLPSYREARLAEMRAAGAPFWLALRESNTLTAKAYRRSDRDSFFVFFSENPVWLRPVFGVVNLLAGLGETVWGLVTLPVDRGQTLVSGLRGTFMSLPELAFANIRKGSNDWVAPEHRDLELQPVGIGIASRPRPEEVR